MDHVARDFAVLGLAKGSSRAQIRRRYRELVRRWHPDRFGGDPQGQAEAASRMRVIADAYGRLAAQPAPPLAATGSRLPREAIERMVESLGTESVVDWLLRPVDWLAHPSEAIESESEVPWIRNFNRVSAHLSLAGVLATGVGLVAAAILVRLDVFTRDALGFPMDPLTNPWFLGATGAAVLLALLLFWRLVPLD